MAHMRAGIINNHSNSLFVLQVQVEDPDHFVCVSFALTSVQKDCQDIFSFYFIYFFVVCCGGCIILHICSFKLDRTFVLPQIKSYCFTALLIS